jgi:hypothetical protein
MAKSIKPADLGKAISQELTLYHEDVIEKVNAAGASAIKTLVKRTKEKAPVDSGDFKKSIASKEVPVSNGMKNFVLFARLPLHRIFHLLVHGHAKKDGGRVPGNPFLQNAIDEVLPEYENAVEEALK